MQNNNNIETLLSNGKYQEAAVMLSRGLMARPSDPDLLTQMARLHFLRKNGDASLACFQKALQSRPGHVPALLGLGELYLAANHPDPARQQFQHAAKRAPGCAAAWRGLANVYMRTGEVQQVAPVLKKAIDVEPENPDHHLELGKWYALKGAFAQAEPHLREFVTATMNRGQPLLLLGDVYWKQERIEDAHDCYVAVAEEPFASLAKVRVANCLMREEKVDEALTLVQQLLEAGNPHRSELLSLKANLLLVRGNMDAAATAAREAVREAPEHVGGWETFVQVSPDSLGEADLKQLRQLVEQGQSPDLQARAGFVLARYYERRGDIDQEMAELEVANRLAASQTPYSARAQELLLDKVRQRYAGKTAKVSAGDKVFTPVFVLGLPRSGTTLTEQILSSHSQVEGSGESLAFKYALPGEVVDLLDGTDDQWISDFRHRYIEYQNSRGFTSGFVVDKAISHYMVAGLLAQAFPEARFIAVHRHPLDVCLGGWKRHFTTGLGWTYSVDGLAHSVKLYNDAIRTWTDAGLPILEINYEDLVTAPDEWVPRLAQHLGLEPEQGMFNPGSNERTILTASTAQVRGEIDARYANRWRRYLQHLGPFISALQEEGVEVAGLESEEA